MYFGSSSYFITPVFCAQVAEVRYLVYHQKENLAHAAYKMLLSVERYFVMLRDVLSRRDTPNVAYLSSVLLNSAALSTVPVPVSSSKQLAILQCFILILLKLLLCGGYFFFEVSKIFWKINLNQSVEIYKSNLDCKS